MRFNVIVCFYWLNNYLYIKSDNINIEEIKHDKDFYKYFDSFIVWHDIPNIPFWFNLNPYSITFLNILSEEFCSYILEREEKIFCHDLYNNIKSGVGHMDIEAQGTVLLKRKWIPFVNQNKFIDNLLAQSLLLLNLNRTSESIDGYNKVISKYPEFEGGYYGRASALGRLNDKEYLMQAIEDLSLAIKLSLMKLSPYKNIYITQRAIIYSKAGMYRESINEIDSLIEFQKTWENYFVRGLHYLVSGHHMANAEHDFDVALHLEETSRPRKCPITLPFIGSLMNYQGRMKETLTMHYKWEQCMDVPQTMFNQADAHRKLGDYEQSMYIYDAYLNLSSVPSHAYNDAAHNLYFKDGYAHPYTPVIGYFHRGLLNFDSGKIAEANADFEECLSIGPSSLKYLYYKGLGQMVLGQFYQGILLFTKIYANPRYHIYPYSTPKYFLNAIYLREYSRYLHSKLDESVSHISIDADLDNSFKSSWLRNAYLDMAEYKEQPPIDPRINVVKMLKFSDMRRPIMELTCKALKLGDYLMPRGDGYVYNRRLSLALGLGTIQLAQNLRVWLDGRKDVSPLLRHWSELYKTVAKYLRLVNFGHPAFWIYALSLDRSAEKRPISTRFYLLRKGERFPQHESYFKLVLNLVKTLIQHSENDQFMSFDDTDPHLDKSLNCSELLAFAKHKINKDGLTVSTQLPSTVFESSLGKLDGVTVYLIEDRSRYKPNPSSNGPSLPNNATVNRVEDDKINLYLEINASKTRNSSYNRELSELFRDLFNNPNYKNKDKLVEKLLTILYYFNNYNPLSHYVSEVSYAVTVAILMSMGYKINGRIPVNKSIHLDALLAGTPEAFVLVTRQWVILEKSDAYLKSFANIQELLPTLRNVLEVFNSDYDSNVCAKL